MSELAVRDYLFGILDDDNADASYLEQEGWEDRLAEYRNGDFHFVGITAVVEIECVTTGDAAPPAIAGRMWHECIGSARDGEWVELHGAGKRYWAMDWTASLWGIESDSGDLYFNRVKADLLEEILWEMQAAGIIGAGAVENFPAAETVAA